MQVIRRNQPALTRVFPHNGNNRFVIGRNAKSKAWTPAALFSNGEQGGFYPLTPGTVFQDDQFTILANPGDVVGGVLDLSGNANSLVQDTEAAKPIYTLSNGKYSLAFDGIDDKLSGQMDLSAGDEIITCMGLYVDPAGAATSRMAVEHGDGVGRYYNQFLATGNLTINSQGSVAARALTVVAANTVERGVYYTGAKTTPGWIRCSIDAGAAYENDLEQGGGNRNDGAFSLGASIAGTSPFRGNIGALTVRGELPTSAESEMLVQWTMESTDLLAATQLPVRPLILSEKLDEKSGLRFAVREDGWIAVDGGEFARRRPENVPVAVWRRMKRFARGLIDG